MVLRYAVCEFWFFLHPGENLQETSTLSSKLCQKQTPVSHKAVIAFLKKQQSLVKHFHL